MALTYTKFNSFAEVEAHYNSITPLRGADNVGKDIRPIGDRKRKWERIVKVSPNCYALSDGHHFGDEVFTCWTYGAENYTPTLADMERYAPIVWRKKRDGTEEVTLRNGWGPHQHTGRYAFLYRHTPKGMWFRNRNGKHFIQAAAQDFYLAKQQTTPRVVHDAIMGMASSHYYQKRIQKWVKLQDDNASLTFTQNEHGGWMLADGGKEIPTPPKKIVRKELKARYKKHIDTFKEWAFTMGAMLPIRDYAYARDQHTMVNEWMEANGIDTKRYWGDPFNHIDVKIKRQVMCDDEHPLRLPMAVSMLRSVEFYKADDEDEARLIKQRVNTWINNSMGFTKVVKG
jgi:hypothetical protein